MTDLKKNILKLPLQIVFKYVKWNKTSACHFEYSSGIAMPISDVLGNPIMYNPDFTTKL